MPEMIPVESSNIEAIRYDAIEQKLFVRFKTGRLYSYQGVSKDIFDEFMAAESKGRYFVQHIKLNYNYMIEGE